MNATTAPELVTVEITFGCCLCREEAKQTVQLPAGWKVSSIDAEGGFCPKHSPIDAFRAAQCPGCVAGWGECPLWKGFAFERYRHTAHETLTGRELDAIRSGICPRRINGTGGVFGSGANARIEDIDLSERAPAESGVALVHAINDYWKRYPRCSPEYQPK